MITHLVLIATDEHNVDQIQASLPGGCLYAWADVRPSEWQLSPEALACRILSPMLTVLQQRKAQLEPQ